MNLPDARDFVRASLRSGNDSTRYAAFDLDRGIYTACNDFVLKTKCTSALNTLPMLADNQEIDFSSLTGFRPGMVKSITVVDDGTNYNSTDCERPLEKVDPAEIKRRRARNGTLGDVPRLIAFPDQNVAKARVYPPPKAAGNVEALWSPPFSRWTLGVGQVTATVAAGAVTALTVNHGGGRYSSAPAVTFGGPGASAAATATISGGVITGFTGLTGGTGYTTAPVVSLDGAVASVVTLNVPDDLLLPVLIYAAVVVQWNEIEKMERQLQIQAYSSHVAFARGQGGFGANVMPAPELEW